MILTRFAYRTDRTLGQLLVPIRGTNDYETFWTIERPWERNAPYVSCIPEGEYLLERYHSPSFGSNMWQVAAVPDRTYILIHVANYADNVQGCIGLGMGVFADLTGVSSSRIAIDRFYEITAGQNKSTITIRSGFLNEIGLDSA